MTRKPWQDFEAAMARATALACTLALLSGPAFGRDVTIADLQGTKIEAIVINAVQVRGNGRLFSQHVRATWRLAIGPGNRIGGTLVRTVIRDGRTMGSKTSSMAGTINRTRKAEGGHALWALVGNTLTLLRTFEAGGFRGSITFGPGLTCTVKASVARENGSGPIRRSSAMRPGSVEVLSHKQISSSCRVTRS